MRGIVCFLINADEYSFHAITSEDSTTTKIEKFMHISEGDDLQEAREEYTEKEDSIYVPFLLNKKYQEKLNLLRRTFNPWRTENNRYKHSYRRIEHQESLGVVVIALFYFIDNDRYALFKNSAHFKSA